MRTLLFAITLSFLAWHPCANAFESTEILQAVKQMEQAYIDGDAEKLYGVITSMKGMSDKELKQYAKENAEKHKGLEMGLKFTKARLQIDRDIAIGFSEEKGLAPLFLRLIDQQWKIIIDWSLPNPINTIYSKQTIQRMQKLHEWYKEKECGLRTHILYRKSSPLLLKLEYAGGVKGWDAGASVSKDGTLTPKNGMFIKITDSANGEIKPREGKVDPPIWLDELLSYPFSLAIDLTKLFDLSKPGKYTLRWGCPAKVSIVHIEIIK